ncbi:MAG: PQQ-binding-like beta-propeller repeat protein [Phycisphaerae bacterium]|nr:PQQ-binding-like beta-propeller repeat protein [Phycisphaerae bacterium]
MTTKYDNQNSDKSMKASWYEAAKGGAVVAGVFSVIILGLLVLNYLQKELLDPVRAERLENLKVTLIEQPKNEQLINTIRELDLQLRKDKIRRLQFSQKGGLLLLGAVGVFLIGIKSAKAFKAKLPHPTAVTDQQARQIRQAILARWVTVASLAVLVLAVLFFINTPPIDFAGAVSSYLSDEEIAKNWASFRGPQGSGISAYTNIPTKWDGKSGESIIWKTAVPLPGHNSPVVWGDRVFLTGANKQKRQVYCFDAISGKLLWQADMINPASAADKTLDMYEDTGYAASTVATDGRRVCAIFPTGDVGCFDFEGKKLWSRNLGTPDSMYGYASSLAMYQNLLLIQYDQATADDNKSKMIALDTFSGATVWETKRPVPGSWTSPIVIKIGGQSQLITCAEPWVIAYNPSNGVELWRVECLGTDVAPSPIYAGGLIFGIHSYNSLVAIKPTGQGDVTKTHIAWKAADNIPDICSPVSNGKLIFLLESYGKLTCYNVSDGTKLWEEDLKTSFTSSPSLVGDRLYLLSEKGIMSIAKVGSEYTEVAKSSLGEKCYASPAFSDGRIYIRGVENLYCIGDKN